MTDVTPYRNGGPIENNNLSSIKEKKFSRDGMEMEKEHYEQNRSMLSIGG